ncbi:MAG TPA: hypothetical protein VGQ55_12720, partial [Pyrinomonadaceae bacterium]|nr:hypothetical protein [Pyrinomonadaceae bacterium]
MRKLLLLLLFVVVLGLNAFAHTAFTLVSSEKKTIKESDVEQLLKQQTLGTIEKSTLTYSGKEIRLVVVTGPEDDMLSYRIQGVRNPNLVVPAGATLKILFINLDADMHHDLRLGHVIGEFDLAPDIAETAGSTKLMAKSQDGVLDAEELVLKAETSGAFKYFCSVRTHAKGGMWGNILVGIKPGEDLKMAEKKIHVHSANETMDEGRHDHATPSGEKPMPAEHQHAPQKPAEHQHQEQSAPMEEPMQHDMHGGMEHGGMQHAMRSSTNLGEPMSREGSGTSWLPDSSPMHGYTKMFDDGGMLMLHGMAFLRYTSIGSSRDASVAGKGSRSRVDAPSMFMAMYTRPVGEKAQVGIRAMLSLDPLIERGYGYPLLYQSGELYRGEPIHDRQHPHDFISELAGTFSYKFNDKNSFFVYAGLPGEPALGPPMYLHRPSGANNPDAPIGHHWQDSTHITYGVVTAGFTHDKFKLEASAFNGTEPDENRWAFDKPRLNSYSGRFSFNPTKEWSFQISHGYLKFPERSEPDLKVLRRTTASAIYNKKISETSFWSNAFVWGQN